MRRRRRGSGGARAHRRRHSRRGRCVVCDGHDDAGETRERRHRGRGSGRHTTDHGRGVDEVPEPREALKRLEQRRRVPPSASRDVAVADTPPPPQPRDRKQRRDLAGKPGRMEQRIVDAGEAGLASARLAVREVAGEPPALAQAQPEQRLRLAGRDQRLHVLATPPADELVVLLAEPAPGAEQGALDDRARHAESVADLAVGEPLELAHDDDSVVALGEAAEGAAKIVEDLLALDRGVRGRPPESIRRWSPESSSSGSSGTSRARRTRRYSSMQAFLAIS